VVTSACTSQPASGPWTGIYRFYADSTRTHFCYQNISKFGVLDVYPASGSPQIGPTSGSKQTISNAIGRDVAASLVHLPRGTELFPGQNIDITNKSRTDAVGIKLNLVASSGFYAASSLTSSVLKRVGAPRLNELSAAIQSCASDVATLFNNLHQQDKHATVADVIVDALNADKSCRDFVTKTREQVNEWRANKEANTDQVQKELVENVRQYELNTKMDYTQVFEEPPATAIEGPGATEDRKAFEELWVMIEKEFRNGATKLKSIRLPTGK
jgi:hypothetical protein